jgi:hypothetical protein
MAAAQWAQLIPFTVISGIRCSPDYFLRDRRQLRRLIPCHPYSKNHFKTDFRRHFESTEGA